MRNIGIVLGVLVALLIGLPFGRPLMATATAQTSQIEIDHGAISKGASVTKNPLLQRLRDGMAEYHETLGKMGKSIESLSQRLKDLSESNVDERKVELDEFRRDLITLGSKVQPDSALANYVAKVETWLGAQRERIAGLRPRLGVERTEHLMDDYKKLQNEVAADRQELNSDGKSIDALLNTISQAQDVLAELLLAEDATAAVQELGDVVGNIRKTIEAIGAKINAQIANPGV